MSLVTRVLLIVEWLPVLVLLLRDIVLPGRAFLSTPPVGAGSVREIFAPVPRNSMFSAGFSPGFNWRVAPRKAPCCAFFSSSRCPSILLSVMICCVRLPSSDPPSCYGGDVVNVIKTCARGRPTDRCTMGVLWPRHTVSFRAYIIGL